MFHECLQASVVQSHSKNKWHNRIYTWWGIITGPPGFERHNLSQYTVYLLAQLKRQGLDLSALDFVFNAIIANKILYALPV